MKLLKKADLFLLCVLLFVAGLCCLPKVLPQKADQALTAVVSVDGKEVQRINLSQVTEPYDISLDCSPAVTLRVEPGCIYYSHADCKDKICVHTGKLDRAGSSATCLPSKTSVVLVGTDPSSPDVITF